MLPRLGMRRKAASKSPIALAPVVLFRFLGLASLIESAARDYPSKAGASSRLARAAASINSSLDLAATIPQRR